MKCPLISDRTDGPTSRELETLADCMGSNCGLWDGNAGRCSILMIGLHLTSIPNALQELTGDLKALTARR